MTHIKNRNQQLMKILAGQKMHVKRNNEAHFRNHCCCEKARSIT